jgi:hypothetical protein
MLMHANNRGIDHLNSGIMGRGKCIYDAAPYASLPSGQTQGFRLARLGALSLQSGHVTENA